MAERQGGRQEGIKGRRETGRTAGRYEGWQGGRQGGMKGGRETEGKAEVYIGR